MEKSSLVPASVILGVSIAIGMVLAGYFLAASVMESRRGDRTVTVQGVAERQMQADFGTWPISFHVTGASLEEVAEHIESGQRIITQFLLDQGFAPEDIRPGSPSLIEGEIPLNPGTGVALQNPRPAYGGTCAVVLQSADTERIQKSMASSGELIRKGLILAPSETATPEFHFFALNDVQKEILKEANLNASKSANQFADNTATSLGAIRRASQGPFEIQNRDRNSPEIKTIRVVTTVEYFLK